MTYVQVQVRGVQPEQVRGVTYVQLGHCRPSRGPQFMSASSFCSSNARSTLPLARPRLARKMAFVSTLGSIAEEVDLLGLAVGESGGSEVFNGMITVVRAVGVHPKLADTLAAVLVCLFACMFACVSVFGCGCS